MDKGRFIYKYGEGGYEDVWGGTEILGVWIRGGWKVGEVRGA